MNPITNARKVTGHKNKYLNLVPLLGIFCIPKSHIANHTNPINKYGKSKLLCEELLGKYSLSSELRYISLRYFNAAGADSESRIGEYRNVETHLIPLILRSFNDLFCSLFKVNFFLLRFSFLKFSSF